MYRLLYLAYIFPFGLKKPTRINLFVQEVNPGSTMYLCIRVGGGEPRQLGKAGSHAGYQAWQQACIVSMCDGGGCCCCCCCWVLLEQAGPQEPQVCFGWLWIKAYYLNIVWTSPYLANKLLFEDDVMRKFPGLLILWLLLLLLFPSLCCLDHGTWTCVLCQYVRRLMILGNDGKKKNCHYLRGFLLLYLSQCMHVPLMDWKKTTRLYTILLYIMTANPIFFSQISVIIKRSAKYMSNLVSYVIIVCTYV